MKTARKQDTDFSWYRKNEWDIIRPRGGGRKCLWVENLQAGGSNAVQGREHHLGSDAVAAIQPRQVGYSEPQLLSVKWKYSLLIRLLH